MHGVKRKESPDVLRILALIFVFWAVMTLAVSMPYVTLGPEEKAPDVQVGGISDGGVSADSSGNYLRILWISFVIILASMFIIYTIMAIKNKDKEHFKNLLGSLMVMLILVGAILALAYLQSSGAGEDLAVRIGLSQPSGGADASSTGAEVVENSGSTAFYAILVMVGLLFVGVAYIMVDTLLSRRVEKVPSQTEELMEKIELAMRDLEEGKKVHDVIIRAYDEMCRILAKSGVKGEDSMTPREFQQAVIEQTGIRPEPVEDLTRLFEKARYSTHPIDDSERMEALRALRELKQEMERHEMEERGGSAA